MTRKITESPILVLTLFLMPGVLSTVSFGAIPPRPVGVPEKESLALSKILKPIPDDVWEKIATTEKVPSYSISKGDTLFDISKKLFGEPKYWPKIWSYNNNSITNPHQIRPGVLLAFSGGTGTSLPSLTATTPLTLVQTARGQVAPVDALPSFEGMTPQEILAAKKRIPPTEWKSFPRQRWETFGSRPLPTEIDPLGFDTRNKIYFKPVKDYEVEATVTSEMIEPLGKIVSSTAEGSHLSLNQTVFMDSVANGLQVGETYAISQEPTVLRGSGEWGRVGYSYRLLGQVKILGVRDGVFVGKVRAGRHTIRRGDFLMPLPPRAKIQEPIPGPAQVEGLLFLDHEFSTYATSQTKLVFVDRGMDDGVQAGMIFRVYQHQDAHQGQKITESDFIIQGDLQVVQVSPRFCAAVVMRAASTIEEGSRVVLLTDVSTLKRGTTVRELKVKDAAQESDINEIEKLDRSNDMGRQEELELKQLERWKGNPAEDIAPPADIPPSEALPAGDLPAPSDELPPPGDELPPPSDELPPPADGELPPASDLPPAPPAESPSELPPPPSGGDSLPSNLPPASETPPEPPAEPPPPEGDLPPAF